MDIRLLDAQANALAIDAAVTRCRLEIELLGSILCKPFELTPIAREAGVSADIFAFPDLRHIYLCADDDVRLGRGDDLLPDRIVSSFRDARLWREDYQGRCLTDMLNSQHWSLRTVWELFHQNYPAKPNVRRATTALTSHIRTSREASEHLAHAIELLNGDVTAVGPIELGLHLVRLSRLSEIPVESLAEFMDEHQRRVA